MRRPDGMQKEFFNRRQKSAVAGPDGATGYAFDAGVVVS